MAVNKLALIRYKTIDECLGNRLRKWTLEDLIDRVSDVLYDYEGIRTGVSRRTIQADIQVMRSNKLGYNAPIVVLEKKYYAYSDKSYRITNLPINDADVEKMKEIVGLLKHFNGFSYFEEMSEMIARLENTLHKSKNPGQNCIQFEGNAQVKGLQHIMPLYQAIISRRALLLEYKSFKAQSSSQQIYYPYLLKEYRNRWFLVVTAKGMSVLLTLALDRILGFHELAREPFLPYDGIAFDRYYSDLIGVTKNGKDRPQKVLLHFDWKNAPYVLTKPLHHSQTVVREDETGVLIRIDVVLNFELEREILGFGECVRVVAPRLLEGRLRKRLTAAARLYEPLKKTQETEASTIQ